MKKYIFYFILSILSISHAHAGWSIWNEMATLIKNNGDGTFSTVQESESLLSCSVKTNSVFFDYNNDGNLDLLIMGQGGNWRVSSDVKMVNLYRNLGQEGGYLFDKVAEPGFKQFTDEGFYSPISVGDYDHDGYTDVIVMCYDNNGRSIDLYKNDRGTGNFIRQDNCKFYPATNGSVTFGDIDNDGWLDILFTGYSDATSTAIKTYRNMHDGTFQDITPDNISGAFQGQSTLSDVNGDGTLDILSTGNGQNWSCLASMYLNAIDPTTKIPVYRYNSESQSGILGVSRANPLIADFNNDGRMDLIINGEPGDGSGFRTRVYYQKMDGTFTLDTSYPLVPVNQDGGINMGDINGDGNMDVIVGGYIGKYDDTASHYSTPLRVYENKPEEAGLLNNNIPTSPKNVMAEFKNGELLISWDPGEDVETVEKALRYNIYVKNINTGNTWMMIPSDISTGRVKVGTDLQTSLSSQIKEYRMPVSEYANYTVGVQTLDQAYAGSKFASVTLGITGLSTIEEQNVQIIVSKSGVRVDSNIQKPVTITNINGQIIFVGSTNTFIELPQNGVYLLTINGKTFKIFK